MLPQNKLEELEKEYNVLKERIIDTSEMQDRRGYQKLSKRFNQLQEIMDVYKRITSLENSIIENKQFIKEEKNKELIELAQEEIKETEEELEKDYLLMQDLLAPKDPNDEKNAIVEIRAGTGGDEAALFASDIFRMYSYYAEKKKWKLNIISSNPTGIGGFKEITFSLEGKNVFGTMRFESGVHRVQRVPETESSGRVHTSAISVAVLPEAEDVDIEINDKDLKIDVYRATGHGGQCVNTTDSAVRITHLPTGLVVTCQDEKSQLKNKIKAMKVLRSRLLDAEIAKHEAEISKARKAQVGTGDRSAKIRTYNFPQSRITDHRINLTSYKMDQVLSGELDEFIDALKIAYKEEKVNN
jgi:peptide chain release factor 1